MKKVEENCVVSVYETPEVKAFSFRYSTPILNNSIPSMEEVDEEFDS